MKRAYVIFLVWFFSLWGYSPLIRAQQGEAGVESPFSIGVGARALGLGSAAVAFPADPSAFYWNPAGMAVVEQKSLSFSLTTLFEGTQYNFVGYVHPTIAAGIFGIGIERIGTGGIRHTENVRGMPVDMGELNYWWGKLTISYAATIIKGFTIGVNFNMNRQVLGFYSTNGFGADVGIHYAFTQKGILKNLFVGCAIKNAFQPRLKLGTVTETIPYNIKAGLAKLIFFRKGKDRCLFLTDFDKGKYKKLKYHLGTEYTWNSLLSLRVGFNNGDITFGGGLRYNNFQLDYGTGRIADPAFFPRSHRFSLIFYFGKSVPEQKQQKEEEQRREIQRRLQKQMEANRQKRIKEALKAGKEYMDKGDYFNARLEFSRVLMEDRENAEAKRLLKLTTEKEQQLQRKREEELLKHDREKAKRQRDNAFVNKRFTEGLAAMEKGDFQKAIEKWKQALERDPTNPQIITYIKKAKIELSNEVNKLIARARQLIRQENLSEAYKVLDQAKSQTVGNPELHNKVLAQIKNLDRVVNFLSNYQEGVRRYEKGDYKNAARFFKNALQFDPNNTRAREFYRDSLARSQGKKQVMSEEVKKKYYRGISLYRDGHYEEALKVWKEALKLDPNNLKLLNAIEGVKKKIETYKK